MSSIRREAQAASALNHPHICTIYEIDESEGRTFIAMELLEGRTLGRARLEVDETLDIAIQIAHGLSAAHAKGIIIVRRGVDKAADWMEKAIEQRHPMAFMLLPLIRDISRRRALSRLMNLPEEAQ